MNAIEGNMIADSVVNALSRLIHDALAQMQQERTNPSSNADRMDSKIDHFSQRAAVLRRLRTEFEDEMTLTYSQGY